MKIYLSTAALALLSGNAADVNSTWLAGSAIRPGASQSSAPSAIPDSKPGQGSGWLPDAELAKRLEAALEGTHLPGAVGAIVQLGQPTRIGAAGVRKVGEDVPMTPSDLVHIGSDTKAMTAVLVARLVQGGKLEWTSTVGELLPSIADDIHPDYRGVTIAQLLRHVAGLPTNAEDWRAFPGQDIRHRRLEIARRGMSAKPLVAPGTEHIYSNLSVMIAGAMAEAACDETWEELMRREVFGPLGMASAGFGAPGASGEVDQPWGHRARPDGSLEALQFDNDPALGPAGTVHLSMADWGRFVTIFLEDLGPDSNEAFLSKESRKALLAPGPGGDYGMGWMLIERGWAGGQALSHAGSNTLWFANAWVAPEIDVAFLVASNAYTPEVAVQLDAFIGGCVLEMAAERSPASDR